MVSARPPKKYADPERTTVTEEWKAWKVQQKEEWRWNIGRMDDPARYFPEDYDKDIGDGCWLFVIDPPPVAIDFEIPMLSLWWAAPFQVKGIAGLMAHQAVIQTPGGTVHLWPHEYTICNEPEGLVGLEGVQMHTLGGDPVLNEEKVWYLQARGIPREEVVQMLFTQIRQQNYVYCTFPPEYVDLFAGVGTPLLSTARARHFARQDVNA